MIHRIFQAAFRTFFHILTAATIYGLAARHVHFTATQSVIFTASMTVILSAIHKFMELFLAQPPDPSDI